MTNTPGATEAPPEPLSLDYLRTMRRQYMRGGDALRQMYPVGGPSVAYSYTGIALADEQNHQLGHGQPLAVVVTRSLYESAERQLGQTVASPDWWLLEAMHAAHNLGCQVRDLTLRVHGVTFRPLPVEKLEIWLEQVRPALTPGPEHSAPLACMFCARSGEDVQMRITDMPHIQRLLRSRIPYQTDLPICDGCWQLVQEGGAYPLRVTGPTSGQWIGRPLPGDPMASKS